MSVQTDNIMTLRIFAAAFFALVTLPLHAQPGGGCNCTDARDLFTRYCAAQGAVNEWNTLINRMRNRERQEGRVISAFDVKDQVAQCVNEIVAINRQEGPGSRTSGGETDRNCNVTVTAPNACMRGVIEHHESWHKMMCEAHYKPDAPWRATNNPFTYLSALVNRMSQQSAVDYMLEERTGYMLEINYTRNRLEDLAARCDEPKVFQPSRQGRSFTLQACPRPNMQDYDRKCTVK